MSADTARDKAIKITTEQLGNNASHLPGPIILPWTSPSRSPGSSASLSQYALLQWNVVQDKGPDL
jgi:hypothetical protein